MSRIYRKFVPVAALLSAVWGGALPSFAQQPAMQAAPAPRVGAPTPANGTAPDVQVVVMALPTGQWGISAVYPRRVPRSEAEARIKKLAALTGWKPTNVEWEERGMDRVSMGEKFTPVPVMSSLTFETTGNVVDLADGTISVEPFARAYRDLRQVNITYLIPFKFRFRGLRRFSDTNLDLTLSEGQGAWTYLLNIKNHQMDSLGLPRYEILRETRPAQTADTQSVKTRRLAGMGGIVLLAAGAGALAWLGMSRFMAR